MHHFTKLTLIFLGISLLINVVAIIGAFQYNSYLVAFAIVWHVANYVFSTTISISTVALIEENFANFDAGNPVPSVILEGIVSVVVIYPHIGFVYEVRNGILSAETYAREEYSCCCNPRKH